MEELHSLLLSCFLPKIDDADDRTLTSPEFADHKNKLVSNLKLVVVSLEQLEKSQIFEKAQQRLSNDFKRLALAPSLVLIGENSESRPWTDAKTISATFSFLSLLKKVTNVDCAQKLLVQDDQDEIEALRRVMDELRPRLEAFDSYPSSPLALKWLVHQFSLGSMSSSIVGQFLPFVLRLTDHWRERNKLDGLSCLRHIVSQSNAKELEIFGRVDVIKDAYKSLQHFGRDHPVLSDQLCLAVHELLTSTSHKSKQSDWNFTDDFVQNLLEQLELSNDFGSKLRLTLQLTQLLRCFNVERWMQRLVRCLDANLASQEMRYNELSSKLVQATLKCLQGVFEVTCVASVRAHLRDLTEMLVKFIYHWSKIDEDVTLELDLATERLVRLKQLCPDEFEALFHGVEKMKINEKFELSMQTVLQQ